MDSSILNNNREKKHDNKTLVAGKSHKISKCSSKHDSSDHQSLLDEKMSMLSQLYLRQHAIKCNSNALVVMKLEVQQVRLKTKAFMKAIRKAVSADIKKIYSQHSEIIFTAAELVDIQYRIKEEESTIADMNHLLEGLDLKNKSDRNVTLEVLRRNAEERVETINRLSQATKETAQTQHKKHLEAIKQIHKKTSSSRRLHAVRHQLKAALSVVQEARAANTDIRDLIPGIFMVFSKAASTYNEIYSLEGELIGTQDWLQNELNRSMESVVISPMMINRYREWLGEESGRLFIISSPTSTSTHIDNECISSKESSKDTQTERKNTSFADGIDDSSSPRIPLPSPSSSSSSTLLVHSSMRRASNSSSFSTLSSSSSSEARCGLLERCLEGAEQTIGKKDELIKRLQKLLDTAGIGIQTKEHTVMSSSSHHNNNHINNNHRKNSLGVRRHSVTDSRSTVSAMNSNFSNEKYSSYFSEHMTMFSSSVQCNNEMKIMENNSKLINHTKKKSSIDNKASTNNKTGYNNKTVNNNNINMTEHKKDVTIMNEKTKNCDRGDVVYDETKDMNGHDRHGPEPWSINQDCDRDYSYNDDMKSIGHYYDNVDNDHNVYMQSNELHLMGQKHDLSPSHITSSNNNNETTTSSDNLLGKLEQLRIELVISEEARRSSEDRLEHLRYALTMSEQARQLREEQIELLRNEMNQYSLFEDNITVIQHMRDEMSHMNISLQKAEETVQSSEDHLESMRMDLKKAQETVQSSEDHLESMRMDLKKAEETAQSSEDHLESMRMDLKKAQETAQSSED
eukprot:gene7132-14507_t